MKELDEKYQTNNDDMCDLEQSKVCDSCGKCLGIDDKDYKVVRIEGLITDEIIETEIDDYLLDDTTLSKDSDLDESGLFDTEYIEDIPELKEKHERKIDELLGRE